MCCLFFHPLARGGKNHVQWSDLGMDLFAFRDMLEKAMLKKRHLEQKMARIVVISSWEGSFQSGMAHRPWRKFCLLHRPAVLLFWKVSLW